MDSLYDFNYQRRWNNLMRLLDKVDISFLESHYNTAKHQDSTDQV